MSKKSNGGVILAMLLFLGALISGISLYSYFVHNRDMSFLISTGLGIGIVLIILQIYRVTKMGIGIPYFFGGIFAILGLAPILAENAAIQVIFSEEFTLSVVPLVPLYLALAIFTFFWKYHRSELFRIARNEVIEHNHQEKMFEYHKKGYAMGLDAIVLISTAVLAYMSISQLTHLETLTLTRWWQEGFYTSLGFLMYAATKRDSVYYRTWGDYVRWSVIALSAAFLIVYPISAVMLQNDITQIVPLIGALINSLIGVSLLYLSYHMFFVEEPQKIEIKKKQQGQH